MKIKENDKIPNSEIFVLEGGEPTKKNIVEILKNKKVIIFGLPGAYTSVCSAKHLPGYVDSHDKYQAKGVDLIVCISVNDPFVMEAWGKSQNIKDKVLMMADPFLSFLRIRRQFYLVYPAPIRQFVQLNIYLDMLITMINTKQKV